MHSIIILCLISMGLALPASHFFVPSKPGGRIIGGDEADPHQFPYQMYIMLESENDETFVCGGSLISESYVLTAAHCFTSAKSALVIMGLHDLDKPEDCRLSMIISEVIIHKDYDERLLINDIALAKLPQKTPLNKCIKTVALPKNNHNSYEGETAVVTGWGLTEENEVAKALRYVNIEIISNEKCKEKINSIPSTVMCTSWEENTGTCHGDSGGPLVVDGVQVGIVSYGFSQGNECIPNTPTIFTRITDYLDWIAENTDAIV